MKKYSNSFGEKAPHHGKAAVLLVLGTDVEFLNHEAQEGNVFQPSTEISHEMGFLVWFDVLLNS